MFIPSQKFAKGYKQTGFYNKSGLLVLQDNIVQPIKTSWWCKWLQQTWRNLVVHCLHPSDFRCGVPSTFRCSSPNSPTNSFSLAALIWTSSPQGAHNKRADEIWHQDGSHKKRITSMVGLRGSIKLTSKTHMYWLSVKPCFISPQKMTSLPEAKYTSWDQDGWNILQGQDIFFFMGN